MSDLETRLSRSLKLADKTGRREVKRLTQAIVLAEARSAKLQADITLLRARLTSAMVGVTAEEMRNKLETLVVKGCKK